nr:hypothetical protein Hi04_10k_c2877_00003 [uncultured bacterium]
MELADERIVLPYEEIESACDVGDDVLLAVIDRETGRKITLTRSAEGFAQGSKPSLEVVCGSGLGRWNATGRAHHAPSPSPVPPRARR